MKESHKGRKTKKAKGFGGRIQERRNERDLKRRATFNDCQGA